MRRLLFGVLAAAAVMVCVPAGAMAEGLWVGSR